MMHFKNPANGYIEQATGKFSMLWAMVFGPFYFARKRMWLHAFMSGIVAAGTMGAGMLVYGLFAPGLVKKDYLRRGWVEVNPVFATAVRA
jgi:hypothetical protein